MKAINFAQWYNVRYLYKTVVDTKPERPILIGIARIALLLFIAEPTNPLEYE